MLWARLLAYVSGTVNQELLLRNEYLAAENRILRGQIKGRLLLLEGEKATLAEIAHRLGRMALEDVAATAKPDTILGWYRKLIANKFDGSKFRRGVGRPKVDHETERLVLQMARENPSWGYDRIVGAMANLGHRLSDQTVGNVLRRHGISPAPKRKKSVSWKNFIRAHRDVLVGMDFFTTEVLTLKGLTTYYVLFLHPLGDSPGEPGGIHPVPGSDVDGAAGAKHDDGGVGMPERLPLPAARPRCEVLPIISRTDQDRRRESTSVASKEPESELVRGTLGEVGQGRMFVEADPVWRIVAAASAAAIHRTLPRGAQPPGQRQSDLVSFADGGKKEHGSSAVSRTTGRPAEILREGSGIKVDGTAGDGLTLSTKDAGNLPWQKTSRAWFISNVRRAMISGSGQRPVRVFWPFGGVGTKDHWEIIQPTTTDWKTMQTPLKKDEFQVATDLYFVDVSKE
jgi:transposase